MAGNGQITMLSLDVGIDDIGASIQASRKHAININEFNLRDTDTGSMKKGSLACSHDSINQIASALL